MCGFTGYLGAAPVGGDSAQVLRKMTDAIIHRGPNSEGHWLDLDAGIALGHRRLAIVDLSPAGAQPMLSASGRYVIAFNGEIYNHLALRSDLQKSRYITAWGGHSDTEVLLSGFDVWGIQDTVERAVGMFAFAVWDRQTRTLTLGRDRLGEKPLYYGWQGSGRSAVFLFGSELKAFRAHPAFGGNINRDALCLFMRLNNVSGAHSIYQGVHKLLPGTLLTVSRQAPDPVMRTYWSGAEVAERGVAKPFAGSPGEAVDALEALLKDAVRQQMMADVPLGAFLSGGVDSSTVVALLQAQSTRPVNTFSIGFHEADYNEAEQAKAVAQHLGTEHTEMYVTPEQAMAVIPRLPTLFDEPFADSSQIPMFLVSQLARQHVTVALSGDAGDELFGGYNRYQLTASTWPKLRAIPLPMRKALAWGLTRLSPRNWDRLSGYTSAAKRWSSVGYKLHKGADVMAASSAVELYLGMVSQWSNPEAMVLNGKEPASLLRGHQPTLAGLNDVELMMVLDMLTYLPDDILTKVDRAGMGVSLETRVPFLDHRVVEFAWQLPLNYKLRREGAGYTTKWALRQVLYRHVPKALIERPKMGFGVPIDIWLRGPLRDWAETLLSESRLRQEGYFNPEPIRQKWAEHLSGQRNWQSHLWDVLMFQAWLEAQAKHD
jgi:asparagine synthase (glutamine-hydrolysing)